MHKEKLIPYQQHMSDDWFREIEKQNMVGVVFLDFSAAFDITDHSWLLKEKPLLLWLWATYTYLVLQPSIK